MQGNEKIWLPAKTDDCEDLRTLSDLLITVIVFDVLSFIVCLVGVFVSTMSLCCGKWAYTSDYKKENDPDFGAKVVHTGTKNQGYTS